MEGGATVLARYGVLSVSRAYLKFPDRRRQLLAAAAEVAGAEGLDQLTMAGLAKAAGVSRQLVYEHFPDRAALVRDLLVDRFSALDDTVASSARATGAAGPSLRVACELMLALPASDRHLLRSLLLRAATPEHELAQLATVLRERVIDRWSTA
ncbi:MAG: TetR family transcriptional regulator, partial [Solirubrobacteraceae bacterium]|nr:TetR family transcriptional regulator [Solirubrobacteraceae bacterium]